MAMKIKSGMIHDGVRRISKSDHKPTVLVGRRPLLVVTEYGDTRLLPISGKVAEVLIANGFGYGS